MKRKNIWIIILVTALVFYGSALYKDFLSRCDYYNRSIIGKVADLRFTEKKLAVIHLNNNDQWIHLSTNVRYEIHIEKGDSIYKKSRDYEIFLIKNGEKYNISSKWKIAKYFKYCKFKAD